MKTPITWLQTYIDIDDSTEALVDRLTFSGIEVEGVDQIGSDCPGVVVGEVTTVEPHPNADRLRLCTVTTGVEEHRVVCGAPNVTVGGKYPFAPVGTTLPTGLKLKKAKIRGEVSLGMLCAEDELGLSGGHDGLMVLDAGLTPGTPLTEVLGPPQTVLDLEITPNRPDCLSLIGVARELAALTGKPLQWPAADAVPPSRDAPLAPRVQVDDPGACPRYTARIIRNVTIAPSPAWMQERLTLAGIRPINNIVDITNYVMLETGHPLHAFDYERLAQGTLIVRRATPGETLRTLDDVDRPLDPDVLLIADAKQPVALAGIMGGAGSEIDDATTTVLLEAAAFKPSLIRATSKRLGLSTDSSYRFERGVDPHGVDYAARRAATLMAELAGGEILPAAVDAYPAPPQPAAIPCRYERVRTLIGLDIPDAAIRDHLASLELAVEPDGDDACRVTPTTFRGDLTREVDLIEEVARLHGLDQIPAPSPHAQLISGASDEPERAVMAVRDRLVGLGLREIMNYSAVAPGLLDRLDPAAAADRIVLPNPLSQDQSVLRTSLIPQLIESLGRNATRQIQEAALFELGRVYRREGDGHRETEQVVIGLLGPVGDTGINHRAAPSPETMFGWIKGIWEALAEGSPARAALLEPCSGTPWETGSSVSLLLDGVAIGRLGLVDRATAREARLTRPVGLLEVDLAPLFRPAHRAFTVEPLAMFPAITRDVALIVAESVTHQQILDLAHKAAPKELESVRIFDIFTGEGIGEGKKSLAYSFSYRSAERTLTDEEANGFHDRVKSALLSGVDAEVRDS